MAHRKKPRKKTRVKVVGKRGVSDDIEQYVHKDKKRPYNPPVGLVTPETDIDMPKKEYSYDQHLDPQLVWAEKAESASFEIDTVSLHVHERIDPLTIIEKVLKKQDAVQHTLFHYFETPENNPPLREAIHFYKHSQNWSNRLIAGDSLLVMNSLLQKEGMSGKVQMIYIDPPYGIKYGSNFQPFVNKREVRDGRDEDLTQEPEMIRAFRDTWELGIHSYLTYLRDRLLLAHKLLSDSGSVFVQISDENVHLVRCLMDEVFGADNFCALISFIKTASFSGNLLSRNYDYLLWYSKDIEKVKYHQLFVPKKERTELGTFSWIELEDGTCRKLSIIELRGEAKMPKGRRFRASDISGQGETSSGSFPFEFEGRTYYPSKGRHWSTSPAGMARLKEKNRIISQGNNLAYKRYEDDFTVMPIVNSWDDTIIGTFTQKMYVVQTAELPIQRCILMTTDPGELVFDPTCGSGTTAFCAEKWGRRWITCDTSRVATAIAKQRLMTAAFDYYELAHPEEGVSSGFKYEAVPHITLKSVANNEPSLQEVLYDRPHVDKSKLRISGPFTVEAVPSPVVKGFDDLAAKTSDIDQSVGRTGETTRQDEWRAEILQTGVKGKGGQKIEFSRVEPLQGTKWLHADAETKGKDPARVVISFGPEYSPLEQRQVLLATEEAHKLVPRPKIVIFATFQFDPEASKDIDELEWPGVTVLKAQMNTDLLTEDLKKKRSSNESFMLMGQPDIELKKQKDGKYVVEVHGFDYYDTRTGNVDSGGPSRIAMWMLDTDYDERSLYPQQVFFPMASDSEGWARLTKMLKAEIDEELLKKYRENVSLPFSKGKNGQIAVKILDDRGIESLRIMDVK